MKALPSLVLASFLVALALPFVAPADALAFVAAPSMSGARITSVTANGSAEKVGLEVDDVIVAVDNKPVKSMDEYYKLLAGKKRVTLLVKNSRRPGFGTVECPVMDGRIGIRFVMTKT